MSMLICAQCKHENDFTRVFCQNCGTRLEREAGVFVPPVAEPGTPSPVLQQRIAKKKKQSRPEGPSLVSRLVWKIFSTAIMAAILAIIILIFRAPENILPPVPGHEPSATKFASFLQEAAQSANPRTIEIGQDQVNNYLAAKVVAIPDASAAFYKPQFVRAFVIMSEGNLRFFTEQTISGYPVYQYIDIVPVNGASVTATWASGGVGRLQIPKEGVFALKPGFNSLFSALGEIQGLFASANQVTISPGRATVSWPGKQAPAP